MTQIRPLEAIPADYPTRLSAGALEGASARTRIGQSRPTVPGGTSGQRHDEKSAATRAPRPDTDGGAAAPPRPTLTPADEFLRLRPVGGFDLIMADPPWRFSNWSPAGEGRNALAHYDCRDLDWIKTLPVPLLAAPNCLLWLWATNPMLPQAFAVLEAWGFTFKTAGHWAKRTRHGKLAMGTGYLLRSAGEPFLLGTRGKPRNTRGVRSVIEGPVREHSRKPDEAYASAEALMPAAIRVELFAHQRRYGWAGCTDDEIAAYSGHASAGMIRKYAGRARQIMAARRAREKRG